MEVRLSLEREWSLYFNLYLVKTKTTQANEIDSLKKRVKKLERRNKSRTHNLNRLYKFGLTARVEYSDNEESLGEDASKQGRRIDDIDADEDITLVNVQADVEMFDADKDLGGEEVFVEYEVVVDKEKFHEVTLAQVLAELKTSKPKTKGVIIQEPSEAPTTTTIPKQKSQDNGKGIQVEEPVKPKKKDQIRRCCMEEATRIQSFRMEAIGLLWSTFLKDAIYVDFHGRIVRIKSLLDAVGITAAYVLVNTAQLEGDGNEEVVVGEGVAVTSLSLEMLTNNYLGGIMVSLIFLEGLEEEDLVEFMVKLFEEDEDGTKNEKDGLFNLRENDQSRKA
nr:hypothetical protein [Tanacetum cinerariifolium]